MGETRPTSLLHTQARTALWQLLDEHFGALGIAGTNQFIYWDPNDPAQHVAPDVYFGLGPQPLPLLSWETWVRGVPDLVVELITDDDSPALDERNALPRYTSLGVRELVRCDMRDVRPKLEAWDIADGVARPRTVDERLVTPCHTLGCTFVVAPIDGIGDTVRLARDPDGRELLPTTSEQISRLKAQTSEARIAALTAELAALEAERAARRRARPD